MCFKFEQMFKNLLPLIYFFIPDLVLDVPGALRCCGTIYQMNERNIAVKLYLDSNLSQMCRGL